VDASGAHFSIRDDVSLVVFPELGDLSEPFEITSEVR
jgi:hypothetical protein